MSKRKLMTRISIGVITACILIGLFFAWRWNSQPAYWQDNEAQAKQHIDQLPDLANRFENKMISETSLLDTEGAVDTLVLPYDLANAWLRTKFPKWMNNQGYTIPPPFNDFMIATENGMPVIAFRLSTPEIEQVISMRFKVQLQGENAHLQLDGCRAGRLSIPAESIIEHLSHKLPGYNIDPLIKLVRGLTFDPMTRHPGHTNRDLRLVGIQFMENKMVLTLKAQRR